MNLRDLAASLWRRKFLLLALLTWLPCVCVGLALAVSPTYESKASVLLLPPKGGVSQVVNPYLSLNGLSPAVEVLAGSLSDQVTQRAVEDMAPSATYEAVADPQSSAPMIFITVTATDKAQADDVLELLVQRAQDELVAIQTAAAVEPSSLIGSLVVSRDAEPEVIQKKRVRVVAAGGVALLVLGLALIALVDGLLLRRAARGRSEPAPNTSGALAEEAEARPSVDPAPVTEVPVTRPGGTPRPNASPATRAANGVPPRGTDSADDQPGPRRTGQNPALKSGRKPKRR